MLPGRSNGEDAMAGEPPKEGGAWSALVAGGAFGIALIVGAVAVRSPAPTPVESSPQPSAPPVSEPAAPGESLMAQEVSRDEAGQPQPAQLAVEATSPPPRPRVEKVAAPQPVRSERVFIARPRWIERPDG